MQGNLLVLASGMAISTLAYNIVTPYKSPYFLLLGGGEVLLGIFLALPQFLNLLVVLPGGYFADMIGRKRILVSMTLLSALAFFIFSGSPSWLFLFIPQTLIAIANLSRPARDAILADSMPKNQRSTGFAIVYALSSIGWTFGPLIGGYLYDSEGIWGIRVSFLFSAIGVLITGVIYRVFLKETLFNHASQVNTKSQKNFSLSTTMRRFFIQMRIAISQMDIPAKRFFIGYMFHWATRAIISAYWPLLLLLTMGFSGVEFGFIELAAGLALIAFSIPMGKFSDRIGRPRAAFLILLAHALVLVWVVNSHLFIEVLLIGSLLDILDPLPSIHGLRADVIPKESRGRVISLLSVAGYATSTISVFVGGLLYTIGPQLPFYLIAAFWVISGVFFYKSKRNTSEFGK